MSSSVLGGYDSSWSPSVRTKPIIIAEGPAGSGKTTFANTLAKNSGGRLALIERSISDRNPDGTKAVIESFLNDTVKFALAMSHPSGAVIDRCFLSQWVYGNLRRNTLKPPKPSVDTLLFHTEGFIAALLEDLAVRSGRTDPEVVPHILYVILLPSVRTLVERREQAGREFPWHPSAEQDLYARFGEFKVPAPFTYLEAIALWEHDTHGRLLDTCLQFAYQHNSRG